MPLDALAEKIARHVPPAAAPHLAEILVNTGVQVKISRERSSKTGDYRPPQPGPSLFRNFNKPGARHGVSSGAGRGHVITINAGLGPQEFLVTFLHEIAHLNVALRYYRNGFTLRRIDPHGKEWKQEFRLLYDSFSTLQLFHPEVEAALRAYMANPAASGCSDLDLQRAFRRHDRIPNGSVFLEELPDYSWFRLANGKTFLKLGKLRKNFRCEEKVTGRIYWVSPVAEVFPVPAGYETIDKKEAGNNC